MYPFYIILSKPTNFLIKRIINKSLAMKKKMIAEILKIYVKKLCFEKLHTIC